MSGLAYAIMNFKSRGFVADCNRYYCGVALAVRSFKDTVYQGPLCFLGSRFYGWGLAGGRQGEICLGYGDDDVGRARMEESLKMSGKMVSDRVLLQRIEKAGRILKKA